LDRNNFAEFWRVPVAANGDGTEFLFLDWLDKVCGGMHRATAHVRITMLSSPSEKGISSSLLLSQEQ
jgi:hypothetical protein